ncbi:MAG TPA: LacI family DNA-binding transcriptional regulator [Pinirhizobacter sp.]|uniref:LacI family DNA-binding transcriptional regulator n=1 Tax=Pinirhizobacter sp. TaxID=2950432 RepID=UPI002C18B156|nr:LacI family DNA-binding transcriptional regulator [Pinirhizobacter sp.]HMH66341.1 LacI family DNA-binding transcriptional regulator [Pinirhizobacter sp.]
MHSKPPTRRKVTLADIAAGCDVSRATVSLVLRGSPLVNKRTRAKVEAELKRQGYVYNRAAANLRRRTSSSIALVINDLGNPFFAEFAAGVDEALGSAGYVTLLGNTGESPERQQAVLSSLIEHGPAGIILSPAEGSDDARVIAAVGRHTPLLVFNRSLGEASADDAPWDTLVLDNERGTHLATEHLIALGHKRIAFFGGHRDSSSCRQRRQGYLDAMKAASLAVAPGWLVESAPTRLEAARQAGALFNRDPAPTAAVCYNDAVALGLMLGLTSRGRRPGEDFAIVGFDDIAESSVSVPPLTTIAVDPRDRGRQAAELVLARIGHPDMEATHTTAPARLVVRDSSCRPASP